MYIYLTTQHKIGICKDVAEIMNNINDTIDIFVQVDEEHANQVMKELVRHQNFDEPTLLDLRKRVIDVLDDYVRYSIALNTHENTSNNEDLNNYGEESMDYLTPDLLQRYTSNIENGIRSLIYNTYFNPTLPMNNTIRLKNTKMAERYENRKWVTYTQRHIIEEIIMTCVVIMDIYLVQNSNSTTSNLTCLDHFFPGTDAHLSLYEDVEYMLENSDTITKETASTGIVRFPITAETRS